MEQQLKAICVKPDSVYTISLASLTDFKWDLLYVIDGPTVDNEVEDLIGITYKEVIRDKRRQYIFIRGNQIVQEYSSYCDLNLSKHPSYTIGHKYVNTSLIRVQKREGEGHYIYRVEEVEQ